MTDLVTMLAAPELAAKGWVYRAISPTMPEFWDRMIKLLGEGNYKILEKTDKDGGISGHLLVSPEGVASANRLRAELYPEDAAGEDEDKPTRNKLYIQWTDEGVEKFIDGLAEVGLKAHVDTARQILNAVVPLVEEVVREELTQFASEFFLPERAEEAVEDYIAKHAAEGA